MRPYEAFEVLNSSWIASLEKANWVHSSHRPESFSAYRHFVLSFHDSTLEFIAQNFSASVRAGSVLAALLEAVERR